MTVSLPKVLGIKSVAKTDLFTVERVSLEFSNGEQRSYERFAGQSNSSVIIIPVHDQHIMLVREYAVGFEQYTLQFPAGRIDGDESPEQAANRELQEEIGFAAKQLKTLKQLAISPSYSSAKSYLVLAQDLFPQSQLGDEPEPLEVVRWPLDQLDQLHDHPEFIGARSVAALVYLYRGIHAAQ